MNGRNIETLARRIVEVIGHRTTQRSLGHLSSDDVDAIEKDRDYIWSLVPRNFDELRGNALQRALNRAEIQYVREKILEFIEDTEIPR